MKKSVICFGLAIMVQQTVVGQVTVLYTNAPDGATVTLSQDVSVTNLPTDTADATGVAFDNGSGSGELAGSGNFSIYNIATASQGGSGSLYGIYATATTIPQYTGNITVVNDRGLFVTNMYASAGSSGFYGSVTGAVGGTVNVIAAAGTSSATYYLDASATATAIGIAGDMTGDVSGMINVTATGGTSEHLSIGYAYGIAGSMTGDIVGTIDATATGGSATPSDDKGAHAYAYTYGVYGSVTGNVSGTINAEATGGNAASTASGAYADGVAFGVFGGVSGNVDGMISATATGGNASNLGTNPDSESFAGANAYGVFRSMIGNVNGSIYAKATGGNADSTESGALAYANTYGVYGDVTGNVNGTINLTATAGNASAYEYANADAYAYGIHGSVTGNVNGTISAEAIGGNADSTSSGAYADVRVSGVYGDVIGNVNGTISAAGYAGTSTSSATSIWGSADAEARQVFGVYGDVIGNVSGTISATATAGSVFSSNFNSGAHAEANAFGVGGDMIGDVSGTISAMATGGYVSSTNNSEETVAGAAAFGIARDLIGDVSGTISATAIGGSAGSTGFVSFAFAAGIAGRDEYDNTALISNFTGNIYASATAGLEIVGGVTNGGYAAAIGIGATDTLYLNAPTGSIHAVVAAPDGYEIGGLTEEAAAFGIPPPGAYAILSGAGDDTVLLGNVDIVGDIDMGGGINMLGLYGTTTVEGDVYAVSGTDTFEFELYEDISSPFNGKLVVDGQVVATNGASIGAHAAEGQTADNFFGNNYEVITATGGIDGTFSEGVDSLFILDIDVGDTNVVITIIPEGLQPQDGENTPAGCSVAQTAVASANAVMNDLSRHAGAVRSGQREGDSPAGPQGPDVAQRRRLDSGEWIAYLRQVNYLGSQDSDGGIAGYDWNSHGFMLGVEKLVGEGLILGAEGGGLWANLDGNSGAGGGGSDMILGSLYGSLFSESWYAEGGVTYAHAGNDADRIATDTQRYTGEFDSDLFGGWLEGGYTFAKGSNKLEPYARTTYLHGEHDGYTDSGGTNPMTVDSTTTDNWLTELGVRGIHEWMLENDALVRLALKAGWRQEWLDNNVTADGQILGINVPLESPESDSSALVLGAKADWQITDALVLGIEYEPVISGNWYYHNIAGELSIKF
jgi:outer membrane autotransporter protein